MNEYPATLRRPLVHTVVLSSGAVPTNHGTVAAVAAWRARSGDGSGDAAFGTYGCPSVDHPSVHIHGPAAAAPHR